MTTYRPTGIGECPARREAWAVPSLWVREGSKSNTIGELGPHSWQGPMCIANDTLGRWCG